MRRRLLRSILIVMAISAVSGAVLSLLFAYSTLPALPVSPQESLTLHGVTVINPGGGRQANVALRIEAGHIVAIEPETAPVEKGGGYVLPGLIDAHVHSPILPGDRPLWATLFLLHGVTSVRNLGDGKQSLRHKREVAAGREAGPRIFSCGIILDGQGGSFPSRTVRNEKEARAAVAELKEAGADCIKVFPHFSQKTFVALRDTASAAELPLIGHMVNTYGKRGIEESGIVDVQHLTGVPTSPSPGFEDAEWRRFRRGFDEIDPQRIERIALASRRLEIIHTPVLVTVAYEARNPHDMDHSLLPKLELLPKWYGTLWSSLDRARSDENRAQAQRNLPRYLDIVRTFHRAGVSIQAGSDVFPFIPYVVPGAGLQDELRLLTQASFTAEESLAAATRVPGAALARAGSSKGLGKVEIGGPADLLLFHEDPTTSLDHLDSLELVIVDGRPYKREALQSQLKLQLASAEHFPYAFTSRLFAWLISIFA